MSVSKFGREFDKTVRFFRGRFPKFSVRSVDNLTHDGDDCDAIFLHEKQRGRWVILIDSSLDEGNATESLIHELAHLDCFLKTGESGYTKRGRHSPSWGKSHAKIYSDYWQWRVDNEKK